MITTNNYVHPEAEIVRLDTAMVLCESNTGLGIDRYEEEDDQIFN